jgi:hypothetical protein
MRVGARVTVSPADGLEAQPIAADLGDLAVFEKDHVAGVGEQRGHVAGGEHHPVADAQHERRGVLRQHDARGVGVFESTAMA